MSRSPGRTVERGRSRYPGSRHTPNDAERRGIEQRGIEQGDLGPGDIEKDGGSVSVELVVFVVPVMMLLTLFIVFCGRAASASISVNAASAAGARAAAAASSPVAAQAAARAAVASSTDLGGTCTVAVDTSAFRPGGQVTVRVGCPLALADLGFPGLEPVRVLHGAATQPIDTYRAMP